MNLDHLKNKIAIVGVGYTPQGKVPGRTAISFHCEAVANAIADAGISKNEIDALYAYRHFDALAGDFDLTGYALAEQLGIRPAVISQEYFCTRGWLYEAIGLLTSGLARYFVIVLRSPNTARSSVDLPSLSSLTKLLLPLLALSP